MKIKMLLALRDTTYSIGERETMETILTALMDNKIEEEDFLCKCGHDAWDKKVYRKEGKALLEYRCLICSTSYYLALQENK